MDDKICNFSNKRIGYLDVVKALGIFFIYFAHFGPDGGYGYPFAFYSGALFFFISGASESMSKEIGIYSYFKKKVRTIIVPWLLFALISVVGYSIKNNATDGMREQVFLILKGCIRNTFWAPALWFLTCLFVVCIVFWFLRKIKMKIVVIGICLLLYLLAEHGMPHRPASNPSWFWNIDSAAEYLIYYCLGYYLFPYINQMIKRKDTWAVGIKISISLIVAAYGGAVFIGIDFLQFLGQFKIGALFHPLFSNMLIIILYIAAAYILQDIKILREIGESTLFLCGSEFILKNVVKDFVCLLGLKIEFVTPLSVYAYVFVLLIIGIKFVVPAEKAVFKRMHIL